MKDILLLHYDAIIKKTVAISDKGNIEYFDMKPIYLLNKWCLEHGSSIEGRTKAFQYLVKIKQKPCILVAELQKIIFMPLSSMKSLSCWFIQYSKVLRVKDIDGYKTEILFIDGQRVEVPYNFRIINNQLKRCDFFIKKLYSKTQNSKFPVINGVL